MSAPYLPPHVRRAITDEIEQHLDRVDRLIAKLDRADAPAEDLEDDDPSGDTLDEHGESPSDDWRGFLPDKPIYGINQEGEPLNFRSANRAHYRAMAEGRA